MLLAVVLLVLGGTILFYSIYYPVKFENEVASASEEFGVKKSLIYAVINAESSFDKNALSSRGAVGLMQILPSTASSVARLLKEEFDPNALLNPSTNIRYGTKYLSMLLKSFDKSAAICAYNAGPGKVSGWLSDKNISSDGKTLSHVPYRETRVYLARVEKFAKFYEKFD